MRQTHFRKREGLEVGKHGDGMYRGNTKSSKTNAERDLKYYPI